MKQHAAVVIVLTLFVSSTTFADGEKGRLVELNAYWAEVSKAVRTGDFEAYKATCHDEGVLVSGSQKTTYPLSKALAGWKQGFLDTKEGKMKANVEFRFSRRLGDDTTAHETGIFRYSTVDANGERANHYVNFEGLLLKKNKKWMILMEYQKSTATKTQWNALQ